MIFCVRCEQWCLTSTRTVAHDKLNTEHEYQCMSCYDKQRLEKSTFDCEVCFQRKGGRGRPVIHADGRTGVQCTACYYKAVKAARPAWTCQQCGRVMKGEAEQNRHPGGGYRCRMCKNREQKLNSTRTRLESELKSIWDIGQSCMVWGRPKTALALAASRGATSVWPDWVWQGTGLAWGWRELRATREK